MQNTDAASAMREAVAGAVRAEMARQRIPQSALADALGLSQQAASRRIRGEVPFDVAELAGAAGLLGVPVSTLMPAEQTAATS